jgi:hypothetical protein
LGTYADILNSMNRDLKEATAEVKKLENNFVDTSDIIHYLNTHHKEEQFKEIYFSFFTYCLRQNFDLNKEFSK